MAKIDQQKLEQYKALANKGLDYIQRIRAGEKIDLKDEIYRNSNEIQSLINLIFSKNLDASQQEMDRLEILAKEQKQRILELESIDAKKRLIKYGGITLVVILAIVFYKFKTKTK